MSSLNSSGGVTQVARNYIDNMVSADMLFDIAYFLDTPVNLKEYFLSKKVNIFKFDKLKVTNFPRVKKQLVGILAASSPDIVHLHMPILHKVVKSALAVVNKKMHRNIKLILHAHTAELSTSIVKKFRNRILLSGVNRRVDKLLACSSIAGLKNFGKKFFRTGDVVYNAIDLDVFNSVQVNANKVIRELKLKNKKVYTHVGRLSKEKNQHFIIDIFSKIVEKDPKSVLLLVGHGEIKAINSLKQHSRELGIEDKVIITGARNDVRNIFAATNALIFPSLHEGLGMVLIEAQASGVLCFASDTCPIESKVSNLITYMSLKLNAEEWANAIISTEYPAEVELTLDNYDIKEASLRLDNVYKTLVSSNIKYISKNAGEK